MMALLLALSMWTAQGIPVLPNQSGTVTGVLRTAGGSPAAGVRVSALAKPEEITELAVSSSLAGIAETDASGRFRLENIPPGRYYIVAGRIDLPTYYPGAVTVNEATAILVTPGLTVSSIDFALNTVSVGRATSAFERQLTTPLWVIPVQTRVEGGGKIPIFAAGSFPVFRLSRPNGSRIEVALNSVSVTALDTEYGATVENLPEGYALRSLTFGSVDLRSAALQLAPASPILTSLNPNAITAVTQSISIVLENRPVLPATGVRVTGRIRGDVNRSIHISGNPGTLYSDGTFEFVGVPRGRHSIVTLHNPGRERALGASIVVGERDLSNVELEETSIVPFAAGRPASTTPAANLPPNPRVPLASIRGRVVDAMTGAPLDAGRVVINSDYSLTFPLGEDGRFEVPRLLPGSYFLEVVAFGVGSVSKAVVLDDQNAVVDLSIASDR